MSRQIDSVTIQLGSSKNSWDTARMPPFAAWLSLYDVRHNSLHPVAAEAATNLVRAWTISKTSAHIESHRTREMRGEEPT
jgi:hypothetical protein